jgi:hypothetical protein
MGEQTKKEVKHMKLNGGAQAFEDACRRGTLDRVLENYVQSCRSTADEEELSAKSSKKRSNGRFPNLAGLCRYYRIGIDDLDAIAKKYPTEIDRLYAALEDEALNSGLPPAVLSAYLKKRLGYDKDIQADGCGEISVRFEHDIYEDGE